MVSTAPRRQCVSVCERIRHQPTNRSEMETNRTGRTNQEVKQVVPDIEYLKGVKRAPLFLDYRRRLSANSVKAGRPGTHGGFLWGLPASVRQE